MQPCWSFLCDVEAGPLTAWLGSASWSSPPSATKPQRVFSPPAELVTPVAAQVLRHFGAGARADAAMLSRVKPGQAHPMHVDVQRADWLTRVHVPLATNTLAWMLFEEEGAYIHLEAGKAYTFDTLRRHAFGNDGSTERVHLIFDVLRGD